MKNNKKLEKIAALYHLKTNLNDMHIENLNQHYYAEWLLKFVKNKKEILEMGYGDGILTSYLASRHKTKLYLLEGSEILAKKAKKQHKNIVIINEFFECFKSKKKYDLIIASHILEHVDNPILVLKKIKSYLLEKMFYLLHIFN